LPALDAGAPHLKPNDKPTSPTRQQQPNVDEQRRREQRVILSRQNTQDSPLFTPSGVGRQVAQTRPGSAARKRSEYIAFHSRSIPVR